MIIFSSDGTSWSSLEDEVVKAASSYNTVTFESAKQTALNIPYIKSLVMANVSSEFITSLGSGNSLNDSDVKESVLKMMLNQKM
jgi:hypothetical protein